MSDSLNTFMFMFSGLQGSYVKNDLKQGVKNSIGKIKTDIHVVSSAPIKNTYVSHLQGEMGLGICPVDGSNMCGFAVLDIDCYSKEKQQHLLNLVHSFDFPFVPFLSKSGGLHLYVFLKQRVKASEVRKLLQQFIDVFSLDNVFSNEGTSLVEIFPKQDVLPQNGKGSYITIPYFNYKQSKTPMISFDFTPVDFTPAMAALTTATTSLKDFESKLKALPYDDAPICIQKALLSYLKGETSGRNDFLFSVAVYLKKKNGTISTEDLIPINEKFFEPLEVTELDAIMHSVANTGYKYKCSGAICKKFCDKKSCMKREYGVGKAKGHFTGIDFGRLIRMNSKDPYYLWELRASEELPYTKVMFKNEEDLSDQKKFLVNCMRYLNVAPTQVSINDWLEIVNGALSRMEVQEVSITSDTTESNQIYKAFISFLVTKKAVNSKPYMVRIGNVYKNEYNEYYFTADGFASYLNSKKLLTKSLIIRETLEHFGCEESTLKLLSVTGEAEIFCWKKMQDADIAKEESFLDAVIDGDKESIKEMLESYKEEGSVDESTVSF